MSVTPLASARLLLLLLLLDVSMSQSLANRNEYDVGDGADDEGGRMVREALPPFFVQKDWQWQ